MAYEHSPWDPSTNPLLYAWEQHNPLLAHGLEKGLEFIMRQNGSYYEAIRGTGTTSGTIAYGGAGNAPGGVGAVDGTSFTAVIQAMLDADPTIIRLGEMDVTTTASLTYPSRVKIYGQGVGRTIIRSAVNDYIFKPADLSEKNNVCIGDMTLVLTADGVNQGCIKWDGVSFGTLENLKLGRTVGTKANIIGVKLMDSQMVGCYFNQIRKVDFGGDVGGAVLGFKTGLLFAQDASTWTANNNLVLGGRFQGNTTGVHFEDGVTNWLFNPDVEDNTIGIQADAAFNGCIGGHFDSNTTADLDVKAGESFMYIGPVNIDCWSGGGTGIVQGITSDDGTAASYIKGIATGVAIDFLRVVAGDTWVTPNTTYVTWSNSATTKFDASVYSPKRMRIVVSAQGNEAGNGKGLAIYTSAGVKQCEVTWNGNVLQTYLAGAWTTVSLSTDSELELRVKGSSATEDITCYMAQMQLK